MRSSPSSSTPELLAIDGVGHLPNLEAEAEFNDALRDFLRAHSPG